jgi:twinkle protein
LKLTPDEIEWKLNQGGVKCSNSGDWVRIHECPFCGSSSRWPLGVNPETGGFVCHRCDATGNFNSLLEKLGINPDEATKVKKAVSRPKKNAAATKVPSDDEIRSAHERLMSNNDFVSHFQSSRGISPETLSTFTVGVVERKGKNFQQIPYFRKGKVQYVKLKRSWVDPKGKKKKMIVREPKGSTTQLYNIDSCIGDKKVLVVEGEEDCMVLSQHGVRNVVSLPDGAQPRFDSTRKWLDDLERFKEIIICLDCDEAGEEGSRALAEALGTQRCRIVEYPRMDSSVTGSQMTDACEFARDGKLNELLRAIQGASPDEHPLLDHVASDSAMDELRKDHEGGAPHGYESGWKCFDSLMGGVRTGELTILTGHTGSGKSAFGTSLMVQMAALGVPVVGASFENTALDFRWRIMQRIIGKYPHVRPDGSGVAMSRVERERGLAILSELPLYVVDKFGSMATNEFVGICEYAKRRLGAKFVLLDHLHFMTQGALDRERFVLSESIHKLKETAINLDLAIWVVCHPSRNAREKKSPDATDLHGSAALEQVADNVVAVQRVPEDEADGRLAARIHLLKLRRGRSGKLGSCDMEFSPASESLIDPVAGIMKIDGGIDEPAESLEDF